MTMVLKWLIYNEVHLCTDHIGMNDNDLILQSTNGIKMYEKVDL